MGPSYLLTEALITARREHYERAITSNFTRLAANGEVTKEQLGLWVPNHRLYLQTYIQAVGRFVDSLELPDIFNSSKTAHNSDLLGIVLLLLPTIHNEEKAITKICLKHGVKVNHDEASSEGRVPDSARNEGCRRWDAIFRSDIFSKRDGTLPWLEAAIAIWGNERLFNDTWLLAKDKATNPNDVSQDADGGVIRGDRLPMYTVAEFGAFVKDFECTINKAVSEEVETGGPQVIKEIFNRADKIWEASLIAEEHFWLKFDL